MRNHQNRQCEDIGSPNYLVKHQSVATITSTNVLECKMISERSRGETSHQELEVCNVSKRLVRQKLKNKHHGNVMDYDTATTTRGISLRCLSLCTRGGGGCKVGAATSDDFSEVVGKPNNTSVDCFSYGVERFWTRNNKNKNFQAHQSKAMQAFLPDDILEMCFMRLPLTSLMNTRLVCKKWRDLTSTTRFMQTRRQGNYPTPWLFLFGTVKDGFSSREIYAFDVSFNKWHQIESQVLKGRFMFSVAAVHDNIFVVGGCSSFGRMDRKTHRGVLIYDSSTNKWTEIQRLPAEFGVACSAIACNGVFYVYSETDKLAAYDIGHGFWVRVQMSPPAPSRVQEYSPKLVSCDGRRVLMVSVSWCEGDGEIGRRNKAVRKVWELDLVYLTCKEVSVHPDAPMDWNAAFVGDKNLIFGVEMFKIFGQVLEFLTMCDVSDPNMKWVHLSKNEVTRELDAPSCVMKSMAVLHL
ncbi:hypothetical protein E3N88_11686 [Mikania micrantha]|uniref:F-box domain-containing protein n=1 Tax=Mikania micrantha TaxID=192012 RepID=A0A5N6P4R4_9ASTR|nr:hypothetical protein E3N88_11686 [Mikania micrantha]